MWTISFRQQAHHDPRLKQNGCSLILWLWLCAYTRDPFHDISMIELPASKALLSPSFRNLRCIEDLCRIIQYILSFPSDLINSEPH